MPKDDTRRPWSQNAKQIESYMKSGDGQVDVGLQQINNVHQTVSKVMQSSVRSMQAEVKTTTRGINTTMNQAASDMTKAMDNVTVSGTKSFKTLFGNIRDQVRLTTTSVNGIFDSVIKRQKQQTSELTGAVSSLKRPGALDKLFSKKHESFSSLDQMDAVLAYRNSKSKGSMLGKAGEAGMGAASGAFKELAGVGAELTGVLTRVAPALAAVGGTAALIGSVVHEIFSLSEAMTDFQKSAGGSTGSIMHFQEALPQLQRSTRLSHDDIIDLGKAFLDAGVPVSSLNSDIVDYVDAAGKAVRMFDVNNEAAAKYTRTLKDAGMSFKEINDEFGSLYEQMGQNNATIRDASDAIEEAGQAWDNYGGSLNQGITDFRKGIMDTKGLFRVFNMDAKQTSQILGSMFSDVTKRGMQASMISNAMGMSQARAENMLVEDPGQGTLMRMQSAMKESADALGPQANDMFMSTSQMKSKYGTGESGEIRRRDLRNYQQQFQGVLSQYGMDPELTNKAQEYLQNYSQGHPGLGAQDVITQGFAQAQKDQHSGKSTPFSEAISNLNKSPAEQMKQLGEEIKNQITSMATWLTKTFWPFIQPAIQSLIESTQTVGTMLGQLMAGLHINAPKKDEGHGSAQGSALNVHGEGWETPVVLNAPGHRNNPSGILGAPMGAPSSIDLSAGSVPKSAVAAMNHYRQAQGLPARGLHKDFLPNAKKIVEIGKQMGATPEVMQTMIATMIQESGGRNAAVGDLGEGGSYGPFQFNRPMKNWNMTPEQAQDPDTAIRARYPEMIRMAGAHKYKGKTYAGIANPGELAAKVQRPRADIVPEYEQSVNALMPFAGQVLQTLQDQNGILKQTLDVHKDKQKDDQQNQAVSQRTGAANNPNTNNWNNAAYGSVS